MTRPVRYDLDTTDPTLAGFVRPPRDEAAADAPRVIDEALQTIGELELRRRFRIYPADGLAIDLQEEGFNLNGGLAFLVARVSSRRPPGKKSFPGALTSAERAV